MKQLAPSTGTGTHVESVVPVGYWGQLHPTEASLTSKMAEWEAKNG